MTTAKRWFPGRRTAWTAVVGLGVALALAAWAATAICCPFCGAVPSTKTQDLQSSDVAGVARLVSIPDRPESKPGELNVNPPMARFEMLTVLKGGADLKNIKQFEAVYFDDYPVGTEFLVEGVQPPQIIWSPPIKLTPRSRKYVEQLLGVPADGADRLAFFQDYLEDPEQLLADDAYAEFAQAPYAALKSLKPRMQHDKFIEHIKDTAVTPSHRRLYLTMLGICGGPKDLPMLEEFLRSDNPSLKIGLDATVACYLALRGPDGLPVIEDLFLKTQNEEFSDIYSVVMALRFLGQEKGPIPRDRIIVTMRMVLDHPRLADQAIMDLARWQDWTVMDRLVELFKSTDPETINWVRVPVINYLRVCPLPKAKEYIEELRKIDPKAVRQSETVYALGPEVRAPEPAANAKIPDQSASTAPAAGAPTAPGKAEPAAKPPTKNSSDNQDPKASSQPIVAADPSTGDNTDADTKTATQQPANWWLIGGLAAIGAVILSYVARGGGKKSPASNLNPVRQTLPKSDL